MDIKKIKTAFYNPRLMNREAKSALRKSLEEFNDISGIVVNEKTGNIVSGNHRYEQLCEIHGEDALILKELSKGIYSIDAKKKPTGFLLRTVSWTLEKEKAANIAANSDLLMGEFTSGLQGILDELFNSNLGFDLSALRFDELSIDLDGMNDDLDLDDDIRGKIQKDSEAKNRALADAKGEESSEVKIILDTIKITVPGDLIEEVKEDIAKFISKKYYSEDVKVL